MKRTRHNRLNISNKLKHLALMAFLLALAVTGCRPSRKTERAPSPALPSLHLTIAPNQLDSMLKDRDFKAEAKAVLLSAERDTVYDGDLTHIKTRGNRTFKQRKKPFTIKLPTKTRLLDLDKSDSFVLLANALDESHIRNAIAFDLAPSFGIRAPRYAFITLYINGNYSGLYQITNKTEVGKNALPIQNLNKMNKMANDHPLNEYTKFAYGGKNDIVQRKGVLMERQPADITGGYLLDNSRPIEIYERSVSGFASEAGDLVQIESPKHASPAEVDYIAERYNQMEAAVLAEDGRHPETGIHYSEYLDIGSFARYYLLNEVLFNFDGGYSSFLMYKDSDLIDPKIYAGPAWDFDRILNNPYFRFGATLPNEIFIEGEKVLVDQAYSGGLLSHLMRHDDFKELVKTYYLNEIGPACHSYIASGRIDSLAQSLYSEANRDNEAYSTRISKDYDAAVARACDFLKERIDFFDWYYSTDTSEMVKAANTTKNTENVRINGLFNYYPLETPIHAPKTEVRNKHDLVYNLYYAGTDTKVKDGTVFHSATALELRGDKPSWAEIQRRRVVKKLKKWGFNL